MRAIIIATLALIVTGCIEYAGAPADLHELNGGGPSYVIVPDGGVAPGPMPCPHAAVVVPDAGARELGTATDKTGTTACADGRSWCPDQYASPIPPDSPCY